MSTVPSEPKPIFSWTAADFQLANRGGTPVRKAPPQPSPSMERERGSQNVPCGKRRVFPHVIEYATASPSPTLPKHGAGEDREAVWREILKDVWQRGEEGHHGS